MDGSVVFARWRLHHMVNTIELVLPLAHPSPCHKRQIDWFSHFCTAHARVSLGMPRHAFPLIIAPSTWGIWASSIHASLGPPESINQMASGLVWPFLNSSRQSIPILYNGPPFSLKIAASSGEICTPSYTWFLGTIRAHNPNGILIGSGVFAQLCAECPYSLQWATLLPLKSAILHGGIWTLI